MNSLALIESLSNAYGACGFEDEVVEIAEQYAHDEHLGSIRHIKLRCRPTMEGGCLVLSQALRYIF